MPPDLGMLLVIGLVLLAILACVVVWIWAAERWNSGLPVVPLEPRRRVPWRAIDVVLVVSAYVLIPMVVVSGARTGIDTASAPKRAVVKQKVDSSHALQRVLSEKDTLGWPIVVAAVLAIVIAPITEELVFRLVLQGWLEAIERRLRRRIRGLRQIVGGLMPVGTVALLFAAIHYRGAGTQPDASTVLSLLQLFAVSSLMIVVFSVWWLRNSAGATLSDLGIVRDKVASDVRLGLLSFLAVMPPVYGIMLGANVALDVLMPGKGVHERLAADPLPLFFLGLALGILYYRTHRIVPSIVLHSAFNTVGVALALVASR